MVMENVLMKVRDSIKAHEGDEPLHGTLMEIYSAIEYLGKYIHPHIKQERDIPLSDDEKNILRDYCKKRPEDPNYIICNEKILVLKYKNGYYVFLSHILRLVEEYKGFRIPPTYQVIDQSRNSNSRWYKNDHDSEEFRKKFSVFRMEYKNKSNRGDLIETNLEIFKNIVDSYYLGEIPETSQIAKKTVFLIKLHEENMRINKVPNVEVNKETYHLIENSTSYVSLLAKEILHQKR